MAECKQPDLMEMMKREEPLCDELARHLYTDAYFGPCLKHPLVFSVPHVPQLNAILNESYQQKRKRCDEALAAGDWSTYIVMHEKPYRFDALADIEGVVTDWEFWELFADTYVGSENWWEPQNRTNVVRWLTAKRGGPDAMRHMMNEDERAAFDRLPLGIDVWRGWNRKGGLFGYSWTRKAKTGQWFAERLRMDDMPAYLAEGRTCRTSVLAYFARRGEHEVMVCTTEVAVRCVHVCGNVSKTSKDKPVVSFDFDGTLHRDMRGQHPRSFVRVPAAWQRTCNTLREASAGGARVVIVTKRDTLQLEPVLKFVEDNALPVEAVYPTCDAPKTRTLASLKALAHYDDDLDAIAEVPEGTTPVYVKRGD